MGQLAFRPYPGVGCYNSRTQVHSLYLSSREWAPGSLGACGRDRVAGLDVRLFVTGARAPVTIVDLGRRTAVEVPASPRCGQPGQQQGRRMPPLILSKPSAMRFARVSSFLADATQQIHSLRAKGVSVSHTPFAML